MADQRVLRSTKLKGESLGDHPKGSSEESTKKRKLDTLEEPTENFDDRKKKYMRHFLGTSETTETREHMESPLAEQTSRELQEEDRGHGPSDVSKSLEIPRVKAKQLIDKELAKWGKGNLNKLLDEASRDIYDTPYKELGKGMNKKDRTHIREELRDIVLQREFKLNYRQIYANPERIKSLDPENWINLNRTDINQAKSLVFQYWDEYRRAGEGYREERIENENILRRIDVVFEATIRRSASPEKLYPRRIDEPIWHEETIAPPSDPGQAAIEAIRFLKDYNGNAQNEQRKYYDLGVELERKMDRRETTS